MTGKINGSRGEYIVNQYVLDFFNKNLKGTGGNLISGPNTKYPEVKFQKYNRKLKGIVKVLKNIV